MLYGLYEDHPDTASDHQAGKLINLWSDTWSNLVFLQSIPLNPSLTNGMSGIIKLDDKMQRHLNAGWATGLHPSGILYWMLLGLLSHPFLHYASSKTTVWSAASMRTLFSHLLLFSKPHYCQEQSMYFINYLLVLKTKMLNLKRSRDWSLL